MLVYSLTKRNGNVYTRYRERLKQRLVYSLTKRNGNHGAGKLNRRLRGSLQPN